MHRSARPSPPRRTLRLACLAPLLLLALGGCITSTMWDDLPKRRSGGSGTIDWSNGRTVATVALTPVALAGDAALAALYVCAVAYDAGAFDDCGCARRCR